MTALFLRKRPDGTLEPTDDLGRQVVGRISAGAVVRAEVKRPRNIGHHRKLWALVMLIYENQTRYRTPEYLLGVLKVAAMPASRGCRMLQFRDEAAMPASRMIGGAPLPIWRT